MSLPAPFLHLPSSSGWPRCPSCASSKAQPVCNRPSTRPRAVPTAYVLVEETGQPVGDYTSDYAQPMTVTINLVGAACERMRMK